MAFRVQEAIEENFERAKRKMIPHNFIGDKRRELTEHLRTLTDRLGPVVDSYPIWHPLLVQPRPGIPSTHPCERSGWNGLDHTIYFVNGFLTCPYDGAGGFERVQKSANEISVPPCAGIDVEVIDQPYYAPGTIAILVSCNWDIPLDEGYMVPKSRAVPLMLEAVVPTWRRSEVGETWETMRPYLLGTPNGARSSFFVSQETGLSLKKVYEMIVASGMYGPVYV